MLTILKRLLTIFRGRQAFKVALVDGQRVLELRLYE